MKLDTETKAKNAIKWIDGLSKTKSKQGTGELGDSKIGYCCLGYGCKVLDLPYDPSAADSKLFKDSVGLVNVDGYFDSFKADSSVTVKVKDEKHTCYSLVDLNDDVNISFRRISTIIKKNLGNLFTLDVAEKLTQHYYNKQYEKNSTQNRQKDNSCEVRLS